MRGRREPQQSDTGQPKDLGSRVQLEVPVPEYCLITAHKVDVLVSEHAGTRRGVVGAIAKGDEEAATLQFNSTD